MRPSHSVPVILFLLTSLACVGSQAVGTPIPLASPAAEVEATLTPQPAPSTATPSESAVTPEPLATPAPEGATVYIDPQRLWGLGYFPPELQAEAVDGSLVRLVGLEGATVAVDSYVAEGDLAEGDEACRQRALVALGELYGEGVQETAAAALDPASIWDFGLRFAAPGGVRGEAFYAQPAAYAGDDRLYGFLYACDSAAEERLRPTLTAVRDSLKPVATLPLEVPGDGESLRLAFSHGFRGFGEGPGQEHFLAVYTSEPTGDRVLASTFLDMADYIYPTGVRQVYVCGGDPPTRLWLQVESGVGAHGGCYDLFMYDWQALQHLVSSCHSSPVAGDLDDIDGDGLLEVILNESDAYVFCYACGVRYPAYRVLRCDGLELSEVELSRLPDSAPEGLRRLNDRAITLAQAGLWRDAQAVAEEALAQSAGDPTVASNAALIRLHAEAFAAQVEEGIYPLLDQAFYGDYPAALAVMRPLTPEEVWGPDTPLIRGTVAEGWEQDLAGWLGRVTTQALEAEPELAGAYFLRGWAAYLIDPADPQALADVRRAAELDPSDTLFAEGIAYLEGQ